MRIKHIVTLFLMATLLVVMFTGSQQSNSTEAHVTRILQQGSTGNDVIELQSRLQYNGFYNGKIDGVFGWGTYWAVRNFQYEFGLSIDGVVGNETWTKLRSVTNYDKGFVLEQIRQGREFTYYGGVPKEQQVRDTRGGQDKGQQTQTEAQPTAVNIPSGYSQNDIQLMANAVYGEARGEPYVGQVAVAAVILNRVESPTFPNNVSGVIFEPRAFTAVADGQIWLTPNEKAKQAVVDAINGWDPSGNAEYYFNPDTATSSWIWGRPQIKKIGKHIFCR